MQEISDVEFISNWVDDHCNGDREHQYGLTIETTDNPGWLLKVDLHSTSLQGTIIDSYSFRDVISGRQYFIDCDGYTFRAYGDRSSLHILIKFFRDFAENGGKNPLADYG